jgi:hypothetical protein
VSKPSDVVTPVTAALVRGALELEPTEIGVRPHRLPAWIRAREADAQLSMVEAQPAGVRLVAATTASWIELRARASRFAYAGLPARPDGVFDLLVDGELVAQRSLVTATTTTIDPTTGAADTVAGEVETLRFAGLPVGSKTVELWLPHSEAVELVELRSDAALTPVTSTAPVWLHHGSSISQGSNATHPTGTWPAVAARLTGTELINLGYGGSALLDPFVARTIRDTAAHLISLEIGINLVNTDLLRLRAFGPAVHGFLDTIRDGHPDTPLLVVSPLLCPIHEDTPGPGAFDLEALAGGRVKFRATGDPAEVNGTGTGKLTLRVIREQLARIVADRTADDPRLFLLDGLELYGPQDAEELPLPDGLHPDGPAHRLIGERFAVAAGGLGWSEAVLMPTGP